MPRKKISDEIKKPRATKPKPEKKLKVVGGTWTPKPPFKLRPHQQQAFDEYVILLQENGILVRANADILLDLAVQKGIYYEMLEKLNARTHLSVKRNSGHEKIDELTKMDDAMTIVNDHLKTLNLLTRKDNRRSEPAPVQDAPKGGTTVSDKPSESNKTAGERQVDFIFNRG